MRHPAAILLLYGVLAWAMLAHGASLTGNILGLGADPDALIWLLRYLPWATAHHLVSPVTHLLWQPVGLNLAWTTCVPLLGLLIAPVTVLAGPVLSFNLLTLAAPALAAWVAYYLCLELCAVPAAALAGGFVFGFSPYEAAESFDHLNLDFTVFVPLALLLALRRVRGSAGRAGTALGLGVALGGQFLINDEILFLGCLFGTLAWLLGFWRAPLWRTGLTALALDICAAAPLALGIAAPLLYAMLQGPFDVSHPAHWAQTYADDALNFLVPTPATLLGGGAFAGLTGRFAGGLDEQTGYIGLPLLLLLAAVLRDTEFRRAYWLLLAMLSIACLASLGPVLNIAGHHTGILLPWAMLAELPLLGSALPARVMLFAWVCAAPLLSLFLVRLPRRAAWLAGASVCLALLPQPHPVQPVPVSNFFQLGRVQQVLGANPRLLILPFALNGASSYWQAENGFGFMQTGGYLGYLPISAQKIPVVMDMFANKTPPGFGVQLAVYAQATGTQFIVAAPGTSPAMAAALASLHWNAQRFDDVTVFTVPRNAAR